MSTSGIGPRRCAAARRDVAGPAPAGFGNELEPACRSAARGRRDRRARVSAAREIGLPTAICAHCVCEERAMDTRRRRDRDA